MSSLHAHLPQPVAPQDTWSGRIATTAATLDDDVMVTLDAEHAPVPWGPCHWMPRVHTVTINVAEGAEAAHNIDIAQIVLPVRGNRCLVTFDENQRPWIVVWTPFA